MFKVDRIQDALLLEEPFLIPAGFNLEENWRGWVKSFQEWGRSPVKVKQRTY